MNRTLALAASLLFASSAAFAMHCPKDMKEIDAALAKNPQLTEAQMQEVKALRASGEAHHNAGEHQQAVDDLEKAKKILGISKAS
jgi:hypothetical protein